MAIEIVGYSCWSCGNRLSEGEKCSCEESRGLPPLVHYKLDEPMPFCKSPDEVDDNDLVKERRCCNCQQPWVTSAHDWLYGQCPCCGAKGAHIGFASDAALDAKIKLMVKPLNVKEQDCGVGFENESEEKKITS